MSYIEQVAKMLGVEIGEEFEIEGDDFNPYSLENDGLYDKDKDLSHYILVDLIIGELKIKKQWKPKMREEYYFIRTSENYFMLDLNEWEGTNSEKDMLEQHNVFKTKEEAEQALQKVLKALKNE